MRTLAFLFILLLLAAACSAAPPPYTVTFDDVPLGQDLSYYKTSPQYSITMVRGWEVIDSAASGWGSPHSGTHAAMWDLADFSPGFYFGVDGVSEYSVKSVGAYFSTAPGVVLEMYGFSVHFDTFAVQIGEAGQSWTNHYVEISSASGNISSVRIVGISSPDAKYHFTMDDLTVVPIPEPSCLLALAGGIGALGVMVRRRIL